jgi:hypothetical protein
MIRSHRMPVGVLLISSTALAPSQAATKSQSRQLRLSLLHRLQPNLPHH